MSQFNISGRRPDLSWVVPMYRTAAFVNELCTRIAETSSELGVQAELVLVDDACPESSADRARRVKCGFPVKVVELDRNVGQDRAIAAGLRACAGRHAVALDADLQDPPEALREMWPAMTNGHDVVFANRFGSYESRGRRLTSRMYRAVACRLGRLPPGAGLFLLMNRQTLDLMLAESAPDPSLLAAVAATRGRFVSVPVARAARRHGRSGYSSARRLFKGLGSLWRIARTRRFGARS